MSLNVSIIMFLNQAIGYMGFKNGYGALLVGTIRDKLGLLG